MSNKVTVMDAILTLLVIVMVFIVARKWVHGEDRPHEISGEDDRQGQNGLPNGVRGR